MIDQDDIDAHIMDYLQIRDRVDVLIGNQMTKDQRSELAMTVMRVHELHRNMHLVPHHHRRPT